MPTFPNSYNILINRLNAFQTGHTQLNAFTHGQIDLMDPNQDGEYPLMHVFPSGQTIAKGGTIYQFSIWFLDLPRDKEDKPGYQREVISDMARIARDLVYEIANGQTLFGEDIEIQAGSSPTITPLMEEFKNTLTGVQLDISIEVPDLWNACDIPASFSIGGGGDTPGPEPTNLTFEDSLVENDNVVTLVNDVDAPGNSYYYGTNSSGVKGWHVLPGGGGGAVDSVNGQTGVVVLDAADVGADAAGSAAAALASANSYTDTQIAGLDKSSVGLSNVDNTSDANKPVSTAQAAAIAVVQSDINTHEANTSNPHSVTAAQVGLGNADNTSDADKPVSTAQATAIALASIPIVLAGGTVDVITATYSPAIAYTNLRMVAFEATGANTTTTPTLNANGLGARAITRKGGQPLLVGDIPGATFIALCEYNLANTRWELLNPGARAAAVVDWTTGAATTGFSVFTSNEVYYSRDPETKLCTMYFVLAGTSDSTDIIMTAPFTSAAFTQNLPFGFVTNNGAASLDIGRAMVTASSTTISLRRDRNFTAWTASGTKVALGQITFMTV